MYQDLKLAYKKSVSVLYTNNELIDKEIMKTIPFITKEMKDFYNENSKTLKKEIEETLQNGKTTHIHESAEIIL
jgi:hypothetical protein